jgi:two-component system, sensor histidine kinase and response regulator
MVDSTGKLVGTLELHDPVVERDFDRTDVEALRLLAHQAAIAIENARLNHLKDEFLSIVSHELKTPVTSIKGFAQVLKRRLPPESLERGARYLDVINHQADRLTGLINDLLDLSRIQSGRFTFETGSLNYGQFIRDVMSEMQLIAPVTTMSLEVPESVSVRGNADRLRQVLTNLIDNAVKYGPAGGAVRLTVEVHQGEIVTCVHDEGTNLPPEEAKRIFLPYYQVRESGRPQAKGLGLGLFISQQIVEAHGGHIWVDVTDHTSFCFTLPQA